LVVPETTISSSSLKFMLVIRLSPLVIAKRKLSAQRRRVIKEVSKLLLLPRARKLLGNVALGGRVAKMRSVRGLLLLLLPK
jgi:hypothetical protein